MTRRHLPTIIWVAAVLACSTGTVTRPAAAQNIIDQWSEVRVPPPPELKKVTIDPKSTALLVMGFVRGSCNVERRPRCVATIPHVKKLLTEARAHGVLVMHSVPCGSASGDFIVADLAPLPGEAIIPPNGPNKFLPFDVLCSNKDIGFRPGEGAQGPRHQDRHNGGNTSADGCPPHRGRGRITRL